MKKQSKEDQFKGIANVTVEVRTIPTYPEPATEELPMFAENRIHQRTSGRPYPNKVTLRVNREEKINKEYTVVVLENEYVRIEILPEIGGRIYSAYDKLTGYDFFYKQHVIKPALIGVLGSWISGGVEFNWPFHHRASGFLPCDYKVFTRADGAVVCSLSEHDPIDRMKGMVSVILRPAERRFETEMQLYNRTDTKKSFLWWENAAVPVNSDYQIFFPKDVTYVNFHYLKSRTTYPIAGNGIFNGIPMDTPRDISYHKNTVPATSYFASASDYDFFGGYDHGKRCGVVHIGDHHVSPGKKMFTWGYCQLASSWEKALTDTDGAYAELMAGSYSDNQPNFAWLDAYETKIFSQYWYPIAEIGAPDFANLNCALKLVRGEQNKLNLQVTQEYKNVCVLVKDGEKVLLEMTCDLYADRSYVFELPAIPKFVTLCIKADSEEIATYTEQIYDEYNMPDVIDDMPIAKDIQNADELYLAGVHVAQYRDPAVMGDAYWIEALNRNPLHAPSLIAMAEYEYSRYSLDTAERYAKKAIDALSIFNTRLESGTAYYIYAKILEAKGQDKEAYDYYNKAAWASDCVAKAMTRIAMLDLKNGDKNSAVRHAKTALSYGANNNTAIAVLYLAAKDKSVLVSALERDPLDHMLRYLNGDKDFYTMLASNPVETCLDLCKDLSDMGQNKLAVKLLSGLIEYCDNTAMMLYARGYYGEKCGEDSCIWYENAENAPIGMTFPHRKSELNILSSAIERSDSQKAKMLLGCLLYDKRHYEAAAKLWEDCEDLISRRNLAVAYYSHLSRRDDALSIMRALLGENTGNEQLIYETVILMEKMSKDPQDIISLLTNATLTRDDCITELAKAYNRAMQPQKALETLFSHNFVPCEGGEHAIADQYLFAHFVLGREAMAKGDYKKALEYIVTGQTLPDSLGAGLWNHCKLVPLRYLEAVCRRELGDTEEANRIFTYIDTIGIEYFSNMHLKELPYYQALASRALGNELRARSLITNYLRKWDKITDVTDNGFFGTTPFFISFVDDPKPLREAQHKYLCGLCYAFMGKDQAEREMSFASNMYDNMYALSFALQGML